MTRRKIFVATAVLAALAIAAAIHHSDVARALAWSAGFAFAAGVLTEQEVAS